MLVQTLATHELEAEYVWAASASTPALISAYERGRQTWIKFYGDRLVCDAIRSIQAGESNIAVKMVELIWQYDPGLTCVEREIYDVAIELLTANQIQLPSPRCYPQSQCLHQLFERQGRPDARGDRDYLRSPAALISRVKRACQSVARHLQTLNVQPETLVGLSMSRSIEMVIGILAILKAGGAYVPLDPTYPQERLDYMLEDANVPGAGNDGILSSRF